MENNNQLESGFRISNLVLLESNFVRESNVTFNNPEIKQDINVEVGVNVLDNNVFVTETVKFSQVFNGITEVSATIKMIGVFEKFGETQLDLEEFGHVNGAAIIFPYVREHLSNLSAKAGLGLIFLPPANFTKKN
jgi:preprotein translocase subunit SecB